MARPRADDYDDKRRTILHEAAKLFAASGFDRTSVTDIAKACGSSKALVYHYYANKEQLLLDIIRAHLAHLVNVVSEADSPDQKPEARLRAMVGALLEAYRDADAEHTIQINEMKRLGAEHQDALKAMERVLVRRFSNTIAEARPLLAADRARLLKPATMALFGMVNWHYLWFRDDGALTREAFADLVTGILLNGTKAIGT